MFSRMVIGSPYNFYEFKQVIITEDINTLIDFNLESNEG